MPLAYNVRVLAQAPLTVSVNSERATAMLARLGAGMRNPAPVVNGMAGAIRQYVKTQFAVGGNPAWVPNRPNTIAAKGNSKVLFRKGRSGIEAATVTTVSEVGRELTITTRTSAIGRFHQEGRGIPVGGAGWFIRAKPGHFLAFKVAGERAAFRGRRSRAQARRRATGRGSIPGRQGGVTIFRHSVFHPGYPARPFMPVMDDAFLQRHWRTPLHDYLFGPSR